MEPYSNYQGHARPVFYALMVTPKALRAHILRLLGLNTILYKAFGPF